MLLTGGNVMHESQPEKDRFRLSRRGFLGGCTACASLLGMANVLPQRTYASPVHLTIPDYRKPKIRLVFAYPSPEGPIWPNIGYDFESEKHAFLQVLNSACPDIDFLPVTAMNNDDGHKIVKMTDNVDGYLVYMAGCLWGDVPDTIASTGKPMALVDNLYAGSGEFLTAYARLKRQGMKIIPVSSSQMDDVVNAARGLSCLNRLKSSTILVVGNKADKVITDTYGTHVKEVSFEEMTEAYNAADKEKTRETGESWIKEAYRVIEPNRDEIIRSAAMYVAMRDLLNSYGAQAITINCLGGIYSGRMKTSYPCLGFMQLDNDGYVGACEADQRSTMTKLIMTWLTGQPGFISDPVIDTAKNRIIYAHCVSTTRVWGPDGPANPYHIRDHSEDRKGACNRSLMPLGEMTTTILFDHNKKQVIRHQGVTVENVDDDRACRTKLAVEVKGDIDKLLTYWDEWGWHRVTFYGDLKRRVSDIATLLDFEVVDEA